MESASGTCPFLVAVVADRLWMYPVPAYCRPPDAPVRVPAPGTLSGVCTTAAHLDCPGFQTSGVARDTGPAEAPLRAPSFDDLLDEAVRSTAAPPTCALPAVRGRGLLPGGALRAAEGRAPTARPDGNLGTIFAPEGGPESGI